MPAKDFLDLEEKKNLQKALKEEERAEVRERILMFLLLNDGKTQREIADFIGCSLKTVAPWCVHGDPKYLGKINYILASKIVQHFFNVSEEALSVFIGAKFNPFIF